MLDELYVIHCRRLVARRKYLKPTLRDIGWEARWIDSHDPGEIPRHYLLDFRLGGPLLSAAEISVYLKHLEAFRHIAQSKAGVGFVIEDDAVFTADFRARFARHRSALTAGFDLVFFGASCGLGESAGNGASLLVREFRTRSMSGYLITASACRRLLAELDNRAIRKPIDHAVDEAIRVHNLETWWSVPPLLLNGSETGAFPHSLHKPWREGVLRSSLLRRARPVIERIAAAIPARQ